MSTVAIVVKKETYHAGEFIEGHVLCDFVRAKFINEIIITIRGEGFVRFSEYGWKNKNWKYHKYFDNIHFQAQEEFLNDSIKLYGEGDERVAKFVPSGVYLYPFIFRLPKNLPTTFIGIDFRIWYELIVTILKPDNNKFETSFGFDVIDPIDLNDCHPKIMGPVNAISEVSLRKIFGPKDVFKLEVQVPKTGIAVREVFTVTCKITNPLRLYIKKVRANLLQIIEYSSQTPERQIRKISRIIALSQLRNIGKESEYTTRLKIKVREPFRIPNLNQRTYIHVEYKIEVTAKTSFGHENVRCIIPVQYGHIPLNQPEDTKKSPEILEESIKSQTGAKKRTFFI